MPRAKEKVVEISFLDEYGVKQLKSLPASKAKAFLAKAEAKLADIEAKRRG